MNNYIIGNAGFLIMSPIEATYLQHGDVILFKGRPNNEYIVVGRYYSTKEGVERILVVSKSKGQEPAPFDSIIRMPDLLEKWELKNHKVKI